MFAIEHVYRKQLQQIYDFNGTQRDFIVCLLISYLYYYYYFLRFISLQVDEIPSEAVTRKLEERKKNTFLFHTYVKATNISTQPVYTACAALMRNFRSIHAIKS
jgi:hypothetical protein